MAASGKGWKVDGSSETFGGDRNVHLNSLKP